MGPGRCVLLSGALLAVLLTAPGCGKGDAFQPSAFYNADLIGTLKPHLAGQGEVLKTDERKWSNSSPNEHHRRVVFNLKVPAEKAAALFPGLKAEVLKKAKADGVTVKDPDSREVVSPNDVDSASLSYTTPSHGKGRLEIQLVKGEVKLSDRAWSSSLGGPDDFAVIVTLVETPTAP